MCGIHGIIPRGEVSAEMDDIFFAMHRHQHNRGPDSAGVNLRSKYLLGHQRLAIIDTSSCGAQPMETDRWVLTYNGEIYNYKSLQDKLASVIDPMRWRSGGDTETLLFMIDQYGVEDTLKAVEGMFAFAAYDKKEDMLWLATDPMGIKPLYHYSDARFFAFASSPGALTHCKDQWELDENALNDYLALGATRESLFKGIKKLMPGSLMRRQTKNGFTLTHNPPFRGPSFQHTEADVLQVVKDSIKSVTVADVPVVMFLSGGIDSSVVASQCPKMDAIHLAGPEQKFAAEVAAKYDNKLITVDPGEYNAQECLEDYAMQSGDCSMAAIVPYIVSKEVSKIAKVAISANGTDELFFGYDRMSHDLPSDAQFAHIFRQPIIGGTSWDDLEFKTSRHMELNTYVAFDLNKTLDFASMCHGLEVRVPYLNTSVVMSAMGLPREKHVRKQYTKAILKDFLKSEGFSDHFVNRPKLGFSLFSQPKGYEALQENGVKFLRDKFNIHPRLETGRDKRYFAASAAAFLCWYNVWKNKIAL